MKELDLLWRIGNFTDDAKRASAIKVLKLWQEGQHDDAVSPYLMQLNKLIHWGEPESRPIDLSDLPK
jgi:hypothetical protein